MINLCEGGQCRLIGRVRHGDLGNFYVLEVSGERWLLRLPSEALATLGMGQSELTELDEAGAVPWTGPSLTISLYLTEGTSLGLGDGPFPALQSSRKRSKASSALSCRRRLNQFSPTSQ
jgi:hypothetical protein